MAPASGVSRARITQVMRLLDLAPDIQEDVLDGKIDGPESEKALRAIAEELVWSRQSAGSGYASLLTSPAE